MLAAAIGVAAGRVLVEPLELQSTPSVERDAPESRRFANDGGAYTWPSIKTAGPPHPPVPPHPPPPSQPPIVAAPSPWWSSETAVTWPAGGRFIPKPPSAPGTPRVMILGAAPALPPLPPHSVVWPSVTRASPPPPPPPPPKFDIPFKPARVWPSGKKTKLNMTMAQERPSVRLFRTRAPR